MSSGSARQMSATGPGSPEWDVGRPRVRPVLGPLAWAGSVLLFAACGGGSGDLTGPSTEFHSGLELLDIQGAKPRQTAQGCVLDVTVRNRTRLLVIFHLTYRAVDAAGRDRGTFADPPHVLEDLRLRETKGVTLAGPPHLSCGRVGRVGLDAPESGAFGVGVS